ncbi:hypothetical protein UlMin_030176 [Ulmus minor]
MGSSLSSPKYDVFLSFRGEDTGDNFSSHLYTALSKKKIKTYADDSPKGGDEISPALIKTIKKSKVCVIIFSENYASSSSCLDELVQIMKYKERRGMIVLPVFYGVDPSHVRKQQESYAIKNSNKKDKVQAWKTALNKAASLSGWDSQNVRPESKLIEEIVKDVKKKLDHIAAMVSATTAGIVAGGAY